MIKSLIKVLIIVVMIYFVGIISIKLLIDNGYTNSESESIQVNTGDIEFNTEQIVAYSKDISDYISDNPEDRESITEAYSYLNGETVNPLWFPKSMLQDPGFNFIIKGVYKRKVVIDTIKSESQKLGIDYKIVLSSLLGEQIRIASNGARGKLKDVILGSTPILFRSYDTSLGVGGIKQTTAVQIERDAIKYGYGEVFKNHTNGSGMYRRLTDSDYRQGVYATYLVKNIITRWKLAGYDISKNPGVVGTLYNMGNNVKKTPNANPKIGGSVINVGGKKYVYGGLSMGIFRYLKIYK